MHNSNTLPITNNNTQSWEYHVISERCSHPDIGVYRSYGIHAFETAGRHIRPAACVHDITTIQAQAKQLTELCNRYQLSPIHLDDFIADYLVKIV